MSNRAFNEKRTGLANDFAAAGAELLSYMGTGGALAAIPDTEPQQYVVAGTLPLIAKLLPDAKGVKTSLEGLLDGLPKYEWWLMDREGDDEYVKVADVEKRIADLTASVPPLTAPAPLADEHPRDLIEAVSDFRKAAYEFGKHHEPDDHTRMMEAQKRIFDVAADRAAPAPQQSGLTDQRIDELCKPWVGLGGIENQYEFARAIEREVAKAAPAAPAQTAELTQIDNPLPPQGFIDYVTKNYTGDVFFADPAWHALKLWNAAMRHVAAPVQAEQAQIRNNALEEAARAAVKSWPSRPGQMIADTILALKTAAPVTSNDTGALGGKGAEA